MSYKKFTTSTANAILATKSDTTDYIVGDSVRDPNTGGIFFCIQNCNASVTPPSEDPTNWLGQDTSTLGIIAPKAQVADHDGWLMVDGREISRTKYIRLFNALCPSLTASVTSGSNKLRVEGNDIAKLALGQTISGSGIPNNTTITGMGASVSDLIGTTTAGSNIIYLPIGQSTTNLTAPLEIETANFAANSTMTGFTAETTLVTNRSIVGSNILHLNIGQTVTKTAGTYLSHVGLPTDTQIISYTAQNSATCRTTSASSTLQIIAGATTTVGQEVSATGVPANTTISAITQADDAFTKATVISGSPYINLPVGNTITNGVSRLPTGPTGVPVNSNITALTSETTTTANFNTSTTKLYGTVAGAFVANQIGQYLSATGIPADTRITAVSLGVTPTQTAEIYANNNGIYYKTSGVTSTGMEVNQSILSTENNTFASLTLDNTEVCTIASGSTNLFYRTSSTLTHKALRHVTGTGIPAGTKVVSFIDKTTQTGSITNASTSVTVPSTASLSVGMYVSGTGIPANARVNSITSATVFVLSANATATNASVTLTFGAKATLSTATTAATTLGNVIHCAYTTCNSNWLANYTSVTPAYLSVATITSTPTETSVGATVTFGKRLTMSANATASLLDSTTIALGQTVTLSANATATAYVSGTYSGFITTNNNATSSTSGTTTFGGSLTIDQNATATGTNQTIVFGENFTLSNNATVTVEGGTYQITTYGAGDGSTTFNLPANPAGRVLGFAGTGSGLTSRLINSQVGSETHTLTIGQIPSHNHPIPGSSSVQAGLYGAQTFTNDTGSSGSTGNTGGGNPHNNMQPTAFLGVAYIYAGAC